MHQKIRATSVPKREQALLRGRAPDLRASPPQSAAAGDARGTKAGKDAVEGRTHRLPAKQLAGFPGQRLE
jgi:hypothetical protein